MGGAACPRIAQETLRRTSRMCVVACRRVQAAQRLRSRALGAGGRFAAYKAEVAGSRPAVPTTPDNSLRACDETGDGSGELEVRPKSVRDSAARRTVICASAAFRGDGRTWLPVWIWRV